MISCIMCAKKCTLQTVDRVIAIRCAQTAEGGTSGTHVPATVGRLTDAQLCEIAVLLHFLTIPVLAFLLYCNVTLLIQCINAYYAGSMI